MNVPARRRQHIESLQWAPQSLHDISLIYVGRNPQTRYMAVLCRPYTHCEWLIEPGYGPIWLSFNRFSLAQGDTLNVYSGAAENPAMLIASYTGKLHNQVPYLSFLRHSFTSGCCPARCTSTNRSTSTSTSSCTCTSSSSSDYSSS